MRVERLVAGVRAAIPVGAAWVVAVRAVLAVLVGLVAVVVLAPPAASAEAEWVWPVDGPEVVLRGFEPPSSTYGPGHRGVDLAGEVVRAAGAGRVAYAGLLAGRGVIVVVHGTLRTTYEPVAAVVHVGDQVAAGAVLGRVQGQHPGCGQPCLHWGLLRGADYLDPLSLVGRGPVRLLPVPAAGLTAPQQRGAVAHVAPPAVQRARPVPSLAPVSEPALVERSARSELLGGSALLALLLGLALLVRRRTPPDPPPAGAGGGVDVRPDRLPAPVAALAQAAVTDLAVERLRRRA